MRTDREFRERRRRSLAIWFFPWLAGNFFWWGIQDWIDPYSLSIWVYAGINIILAASLNLINGWTGQFSMGHAGFMGIGAYISAFLSLWQRDQLGWNYSFLFPVNLTLGALCAAMVGALLGMPSLRLKGDYLAIVTLGLGEIIRVVLLNLSWTGGARGLPNIPLNTDINIVWDCVCLTLFLLWRLIQSHTGRGFLAVREDEIAASSIGINTTEMKVRAFAIGAFFAGLAGGLFAHYLTYLNPQSFDLNRSFEIIIMVVLGGMGSLSGSVIAAVFLSFSRELLRPLQEITHVDIRMIIYSILLIGLMLTRPNGIFGQYELKDLIATLRKKRS